MIVFYRMILFKVMQIVEDDTICSCLLYFISDCEKCRSMPEEIIASCLRVQRCYVIAPVAEVPPQAVEAYHIVYAVVVLVFIAAVIGAVICCCKKCK